MNFEFSCPEATVLTFADGDAALEELERGDPDLFTTDWNHLGLDADSLLRALAARGVNYPVFVISAHGFNSIENDRLKGVRDAGLNVAVLSKPFLLEDFQRLLSSRGIKLEGPSARKSV